MILLRAIRLPVIALALGVLAQACNPAMAFASSAPRTEVKRIVVEEALRAALAPSLALAVAKVESDFSPQALSPKGARGVMQIMPRTARDLFGVDAAALWDARRNVRLGIDYLSALIERYGGSWELALSHYNGGTLARHGGIARPHRATQAYVAQVFKWHRLYADQERVWDGRRAHAVSAPAKDFAAVEQRARSAARRLDDFGGALAKSRSAERWLEVGRMAVAGAPGARRRSPP
jgi:hypothetical protein